MIKRDRWELVFWVALALGLFLRILTVASEAFSLDSDTSVVFLMAVHSSHGEFEPFFWGQGYGGTLIQSLSGIAMVVFGPLPAVVAAVEIALMAMATILFRSVATHAFGRSAAISAAVVVWLPGFYLLKQTTIDPGFYVSSIAAAFAALAFALSPREWGAGRWAIVGLFAGVAFWQSIMGAALAAPAFLLLWHRRSGRREFLFAAAGFVVGALPWIVGSVERSLASTLRPGGNPFTGFLDNAAGLVLELIPAAITGGTGSWVQVVVGVAVLVGVIAAFVVAFRTRNAAAVMIFGGAIAVGAVLIASGAPLGEDSRRYAAFFVPAIASSAAWAGLQIRASGVLVGGAVAITLATYLATPAALTWRHNTETIWGRNAVALAQELERRGVDAVFSGYWMAYRLTAASGEVVTVGALPVSRYAPYATAALERTSTAIAVIVGGENDHRLQSFVEAGRATREEVAGYALYLFKGKIDPYTLELGIQ